MEKAQFISLCGLYMITLVTGASGYIGSHVVGNLLSKGMEVRATVRDSSDPERVDHLKSLKVAEGGRLEIIEMDVLDAVAVENAVLGCNNIIHTAAVLTFGRGIKDPEKEVVDPSVIGTKNVLDAIDNNGEVKCLVHTSSVAAVRPQNWKNGEVLDENSWANDAKLKTDAYSLAKYSSERLVRDWYESKEDKELRMITINPCVVLGPVLSKRHLTTSPSIVMMLINNEIPFIVPVDISIVDVRDVAEAHVKSLSEGKNSGRYLLASGNLWLAEIAKKIKMNYPKIKVPSKQLPYLISLVASIFNSRISFSWARRNLGKRLFWDSNRAKNELGIDWISPTESVLDTVKSVIDNDWIGKS